MSETPDEIALPHFEDRLRAELEWLHRQRQPSPTAAAEMTATGRWHRPGRWSLLAGAAAIAIVAAVLAAQLVTGDEPERVADSGAAATPPPEPQLVEAAVVQRIIDATAAIPPDAIVHETNTYSPSTDINEMEATEPDETFGSVDVEAVEGSLFGDEPDGYTETWTDPVTAARRFRRVNVEGKVLYDSGWPEPPAIDEPPDPWLGTPFVPAIGACDPSSALMMDADGNLVPCTPTGPNLPQPLHAERIVDYCREEYIDTSGPLLRPTGYGYIRLFLETGDIFEDGTEELDGRSLLRLRNADESAIMLVDPESYLPVQMDVGGLATTVEFLPRTTENLALLSPEVPDGFRHVIAEDWMSVEVTPFADDC